MRIAACVIVYVPFSQSHTLHFFAASQCSLPATSISNLENSRPIFCSWQNTCATPHVIPVHAHRMLLFSQFNGRRGALRDPQERCPRTHVAVLDSPYLLVHSPCLAGGDGRDRERHHRGQNPQRVRRVLQMGCVGTSGGCRRVELSLAGAAAAFLITFTMESVGSIPHFTAWARALFLTLTELSSRLQWEVRRWQSTVGLHWRRYMLGWNVRRLA